MNNGCDGRRPRLIVAGTGSGSGKTTVTLGLMRAFAHRGLKVQGFKCGPDYIDPAYHTAACGCTSRNLDSWMTPAGYLPEYFRRASEPADISIIEGVMGLYDGKEADALTGSTAEIALLTDTPVLLVVDARSMGRSAAAVVLGFRCLEPRVNIAAVMLNRCGSKEHYALVKTAVEAACGIPVIGWLGRDELLNIPERHLGLLPAVERGELEPLFNRAAEALEAGADLDGLLRIASSAPPLAAISAGALHVAGGHGSVSLQVTAGHDTASAATDTAEDDAALVRDASSGVNAAVCASRGEVLKTSAICTSSGAAAGRERLPLSGAPVLAVARDAAFNFYYADNLELLAEAGARLVFFSPLRGDGIPEDADGIYLGGGFPEEFAAVISDNTAFLGGLRNAAANGMPLYAECGGYMVLARSLTDRAGCRHEMAGIVPASTEMRERRAALGYREVTAQEDNLLLKRGERLRGHEFHYSVMNYDPGEPAAHAYASEGRQGCRPEGFTAGNVLAAYAHVHFASYPPAAARLVEACRAYARRKKGNSW